MKIKKIKSKKEKFLIKLDLAFLIICILITQAKLFYNNNTNLIDIAIKNYKIFKNINILVAILISILSSLLVIAYKTFWINIIYLIYRLTRRKSLKENLRYEVIENIEYYRDTFKSLSPAEISLISDLELETQKDITATIMKLNMNNYIEFENDKIHVLDKNTDNLRPSEKELLLYLSDGNLDILDQKKWEKFCIDEAIKEGYIRPQDAKPKKHFWFSTILFIASILFIIHYNVFTSSSKYDTYLDSFVNIATEEYELEFGVEQYKSLENIPEEEFIAKLQSDPKMLKSTIKVWKKLITIDEIKIPIFYSIGIVISIIFLITIPIYKIIRSIIYKKVYLSNRYVRTYDGKILAEQIAAMKKYIHDFSLLSNKEKEQIKLWDEFLVYAIILEENDNIIDDIYSYKNIKKINLF